MGNQKLLPEGFPDPDAIFTSWYPIIIAVVCGALYAIRQYLRGPKCMGTADLKGKTAIVTGANTGIGQHVAFDLAYKGAKVILACKNLEAGQEAVDDIKKRSRNENVKLMKLNLASFVSIRDFVEEFKKNESNLDILVNNAGVMMMPFMESEENFEMQFGVNYLGTFLLTELLLDVLKKTKGSRIINTIASAVNLGDINYDDINLTKDYSPGKGFAQSKYALAVYSLHLADRLKDFGVNVYLVNPGVVNSNAHRYMPFRSNKFLSFGFTVPMYFLMKLPEDGAQTTIYCSTAQDLDKVTGKCYKDLAEVQLDDNVTNIEHREKLYKQTLIWTQLKDQKKKALETDI
ncbi:hypothetical protein LOTGIDRAFT_197173 [Lottia gigantea]|uniref:Retinol dehydrogenase 14 n=1 Tax=Lottia gigantea TaxID=225164 RepID=V3YZA7_LOTGI|nr:hypothetical protein LOTGIDRAFT_197173 [Lottia gigantea]ESO83498.1 hypothetical protein LOTGIDRAFT_197173 [Lottia gigantea]